MSNNFKVELVSMGTIFNILINLLIVAAVAYIGILAYLYVFQRHLLYLPAKEIGMPANYGLASMQEVKLHTSDGLTIIAWYKPAQGHKPTEIYFHGNRGNLADRSEKIEAMLETGMGLLAVSYRGY